MTAGARRHAVVDSIERLGAADFDETMAFLNTAFAVHGPHDFARLLPSIYQPDEQHMRCNLALRRAGRIAALVGIFPIDLRVGSERLRVAGVGGVSVAPDQQGQGLLETMMLRARAVLAADEYQLSYLLGPRQRYKRWGWEVGGANLRLTIEPRNIKHAFRDAAQAALVLEPLADSPERELVARLQALHDAQPLHCARQPEHFARYLRSWGHQPLLARTGDGRIVGYATGNPAQRTITELVAESTAAALDLVRALSERYAGTLEISVHALPDALTDELAAIAERAELRTSGNWQIWDWTATIGSLLRLRHALRPLPEGRVVVGLAGGERYALWVTASQAGCDRVAERPAFETNAEELARVLFGPLPAALACALPEEAERLSAWCPLPLAISAQDQV